MKKSIVDSVFLKTYMFKNLHKKGDYPFLVERMKISLYDIITVSESLHFNTIIFTSFIFYSELFTERYFPANEGM